MQNPLPKTLEYSKEVLLGGTMEKERLWDLSAISWLLKENIFASMVDDANLFEVMELYFHKSLEEDFSAF